MRQEDFEQAAYYLTSQGAWPVGELRRLRMFPELRINNDSFLSAFGDRRSGRNPLDRERMALLLTYLPDNSLARMDRGSMANSVETRAPFLHPALSDFSARLPINLQVRGSVLKYILRQALIGSVPSEIARRPKHGFHAIPMVSWMRAELGSLIREFLDPALLKRQGIFNAECVARVLREHKQGGRFNHWWKLWLLLVVQMWLRRYARKSPGPLTRESVAAGKAIRLTSSQENFRAPGANHVAGLQDEL
jgi:asparagine synthase (glutamine-hydrolysing)